MLERNAAKALVAPRPSADSTRTSDAGGRDAYRAQLLYVGPNFFSHGSRAGTQSETRTSCHRSLRQTHHIHPDMPLPTRDMHLRGRSLAHRLLRSIRWGDDCEVDADRTIGRAERSVQVEWERACSPHLLAGLAQVLGERERRDSEERVDEIRAYARRD